MTECPVYSALVFILTAIITDCDGFTCAEFPSVRKSAISYALLARARVCVCVCVWGGGGRKLCGFYINIRCPRVHHCPFSKKRQGIFMKRCSNYFDSTSTIYRDHLSARNSEGGIFRNIMVVALGIRMQNGDFVVIRGQPLGYSATMYLVYKSNTETINGVSEKKNMSLHPQSACKIQ
jgi:hypothetical protein